MNVLGPLQVQVDGGSIDVGGPKARALLATLAHHLGDVVRLDTLIEALWDDNAPRSARNVIQVRLSGLRKMLEPAAKFTTTPSGYALQPDGVTVDSVDFERLAKAAIDHLDTDPSSALQLADEALAMWRGEPVGIELDIRPLEGLLGGLDELRTRIQLARLDALLELGQHVECCAEADNLADRHPYREDFRERQMLALYRSGRQAEALAAYRQARNVLVDELGVEPGPRLQALHRQILEQATALDVADAAPTRPTSTAAELATDNVRAEPNTFVERPETDAVISALQPGRIVTVVGTGGIGKSRCVNAAARRCLDAEAFSDGVWLIDLAPLPEGSDAVAAIAGSAMGLGQQPGVSMVDTIVSYLHDRRALLVLDNCEHVATAAAAFANVVATRCRSTSVLAASRIRLGPVEETVITLDRLPDDAANRLLTARIQEAGAGPFSEDDGAALCAVLDNYPLAIELASARTRSMGPREIAARLDAQPQLLRSSPASVAANTSTPGSSRRHTDLATALDWSLDQLSPDALATLRRSTVFVSDFDLDSAEAVLSTSDRSAGDVVDDLGELVEHHLVSRDHGRARFRVLEPIRQHLRATADVTDSTTYSRHYEAMAIEAMCGLRGPDEAVWWDRVNTELPHIREVVRAAIERRDVERLEQLMTQMAVASPLPGFTEPGEWALDAITRLQLAPADAPATTFAAAFHHAHHKQRDACTALVDQLETVVDDPLLEALVHTARAFNDPSRADMGPAGRTAADASGDEALAVYASISQARPDVTRADRHGNPTLRTFARSFLSAYVITDISSDEARQNKRELYRIALTSNNSQTIAGAQGFMAIQHCVDNDPSSAAPLAVEMIERFARGRSPFWIWHGVEIVAVMLAMARMDPFTSEKLWAGVTASGTIPYSRLTRNPELPVWVASQLTSDQQLQAISEGSLLDMDAAVLEARKAAEQLATEPMTTGRTTTERAATGRLAVG